MPQPQRVRPGQPIRAKDLNDLRAALLPSGGWGSTAAKSADGGNVLRLFEATEDLSIDPEQPDDLPRGEAVEVWRSLDDEEYVAQNDRKVTLYDHHVYSPLGEGQRAWATFNRQTGRWEVVEQLVERKIGKLALDIPTITEHFETGINASFNVYEKNPDTGVWEETETVSVRVLDKALSGVEAGTYAEIQWIHGAWQFYWVSCEV